MCKSVLKVYIILIIALSIYIWKEWGTETLASISPIFSIILGAMLIVNPDWLLDIDERKVKYVHMRMIGFFILLLTLISQLM